MAFQDKARFYPARASTRLAFSKPVVDETHDNRRKKRKVKANMEADWWGYCILTGLHTAFHGH